MGADPNGQVGFRAATVAGPIEPVKTLIKRSAGQRKLILVGGCHAAVKTPDLGAVAQDEARVTLKGFGRSVEHDANQERLMAGAGEVKCFDQVHRGRDPLEIVSAQKPGPTNRTKVLIEKLPCIGPFGAFHGFLSQLVLFGLRFSSNYSRLSSESKKKGLSFYLLSLDPSARARIFCNCAGVRIFCSFCKSSPPELTG
jgi:hypothetical protein